MMFLSLNKNMWCLRHKTRIISAINICDQWRVKRKMYARRKKIPFSLSLSISTSVFTCKEVGSTTIFTVFIILCTSLFNPISFFMFYFLPKHTLFCLPLLFLNGRYKGAIETFLWLYDDRECSIDSKKAFLSLNVICIE